jgi:hypothetical protein
VIGQLLFLMQRVRCNLWHHPSLNGITFPATQVASADANTLDDYEEGIFTPAIAFGGASVGITYSQQQGFYTKIGNLVTCQIRIVLSNKGSSSGDASITGLPIYCRWRGSIFWGCRKNI